MATRQREALVVKGSFSLTCRMAGKASVALIDVATYTHVLIFRLRTLVTGCTREDRVVVCIGMALCTLTPHTGMCTAVDGEVLVIMIKGGWCPRVFGVTGCAICGEVKRNVRWIGSCVVIILVTTHTRIRRVVIIPVVACHTLICDQRMRPCKYIILIVDIKRSRVPIRDCCMAGCTISR